MDKDRDFLIWIHERLRGIIAETPKDRSTGRKCSGGNSMESLKKILDERD